MPTQTEKQVTIRAARSALDAARIGLVSIRGRLRRTPRHRDEIRRDLDRVKAQLDRVGSQLDASSR